MIWRAQCRCGETEVFEAPSWSEAWKQAEYWVTGGGEDCSCLNLEVALAPADNSKPPRTRRFLLGSLDRPPRCLGTWEHLWSAPRALVGDGSLGPGVLHIGAGYWLSRRVCGRCGAYRICIWETAIGEPIPIPEVETYARADERSREWLEKCQRAHVSRAYREAREDTSAEAAGEPSPEAREENYRRSYARHRRRVAAALNNRVIYWG